MRQATKTPFELEVMRLVKKYREEKHYSQENVAEVLNVSKGFVGQIESPENPSTYNLNHLNILANEFDCSPKDFLPEFTTFKNEK